MTACIKLAASLGYHIGPDAVLEDVASGANLDRSQLNNLRGSMAAGEVSVVFIPSIDRLSRDLSDLLLLMREFTQHAVAVHFVQCPPGSAAESMFLDAIREFCVDRERAEFRKRTVRGKDATARSGRMPTGIRSQPYGYDWDPATKKRVVNEVEARVVQRVFGLYAEGLSMAEIVKMLNADGL